MPAFTDKLAKARYTRTIPLEDKKSAEVAKLVIISNNILVELVEW
jgi:hypothetical protein